MSGGTIRVSGGTIRVSGGTIRVSGRDYQGEWQGLSG